MFRAAVVARRIGSISLSRQQGRNVLLLRIQQQQQQASRRPMLWRALSTSNNKETKQQDNEEETMTQEIMLTPGEKVVAGTRLTMWVMAGAFASVCAYYILKELIPT